MERIVQAKASWCRRCPPAPEGAWPSSTTTTRWCWAWRGRTAARVFYLRPGRHEADLWADECQGLGAGGHPLPPPLPGRKTSCTSRCRLLGRHSVHTALRGGCGGLVEGLTWQEIIEGLRSPAPLNCAWWRCRGLRGSTILDDTYNASPASTWPRSTCSTNWAGARSPCWATCWSWATMSARGTRKVGMRALEVVRPADHGRAARARIIGETALRWGMPAGRVHMVPRMRLRQSLCWSSLVAERRCHTHQRLARSSYGEIVNALENTKGAEYAESVATARTK
jgi:UDP-N-acetylmuramoyl-tripeptide--D-alanyl-D-alanine ligase